MAGKTKVWFTPYEMMDLGFLAGSGSRVQSFHAFTMKLGWSRPEYEYTLWHWASRGGQRRKLWHLGRCREFSSSMAPTRRFLATHFGRRSRNSLAECSRR